MVATGDEALDRLCALILPWAYEHERAKYEETMTHAAKPHVLRKFCVRLMLLRVTREPSFVKQIPLSILEESALEVRLRDRTTGEIITVRGARASGERTWTFQHLMMPPNAFRAHRLLTTMLDLEVLPPTCSA